MVAFRDTTMVVRAVPRTAQPSTELIRTSCIVTLPVVMETTRSKGEVYGDRIEIREVFKEDLVGETTQMVDRVASREDGHKENRCVLYVRVCDNSK